MPARLQLSACPSIDLPPPYIAHVLMYYPWAPPTQVSACLAMVERVYGRFGMPVKCALSTRPDEVRPSLCPPYPAPPHTHPFMPTCCWPRAMQYVGRRPTSSSADDAAHLPVAPHPLQFIGSEAVWAAAERSLAECLERTGRPYTIQCVPHTGGWIGLDGWDCIGFNHLPCVT
jgi:threonyl-tRNA synthetase